MTFLDIYGKNLRFSTRNFFLMILFKYKPQKCPIFKPNCSSFLVIYHKNNLCLANFSNFFTDFIHSYCLSRKGAVTLWLIYHTILQYWHTNYTFVIFISRYTVPARTVTKILIIYNYVEPILCMGAKLNVYALLYICWYRPTVFIALIYTIKVRLDLLSVYGMHSIIERVVLVHQWKQ